MILLDSDIRRAVADRNQRAGRFKQRGFLLNPFRFGGGGGGGGGTVALMLHGNGSNGGTTFTDSSTFNHTLTAFGNVQTSTTQFKYGTAALAFDGTDDRLTLSSANIVLGTGSFCIECWTWGATNSFTRNAGVFQLSTVSGGLTTNNTTNIAVFYGTGGIFQFIRNGALSGGGISVTANAWNHIAVTRSGTTTTLWINGAKASGESTTDSTNYTGQELCVGGYFSTSFLANGYIDDFRITIGAPVYTSAFTPPSGELSPP